jgi:carbon-monoxide dehydrogenase medium subunit
MKPAPFDYVRPASVAGASVALGRRGATTAAIAGGQSLLPMLALRVVGRNGVRVQSIDDFMQGAFETTLITGDIIMGFDSPAPPRAFRWGFAKVARKSGAFAQSIAIVTQDGKDGPITAVLGGAGARPHALTATSNVLQLPEGTEEARLRAVIAADLMTLFPGLDAYQTRMHTANILRAVREMRTQ